MKISIDLTGVQIKLQRAGAALNPQAMLKVMAQRLVAYIAEQFESDGQGRWAPLAESTVAKRRLGSNRPLQNTGEYRKSWTGQRAPNDPPVDTDDRSYVRVGTEMHPIAEWMEYGTPPRFIAAQNKMVLAARLAQGGFMVFGRSVNHPGSPARPVLPSNAEAYRMLSDTVNAMVDDVIAHGPKP